MRYKRKLNSGDEVVIALSSFWRYRSGDGILGSSFGFTAFSFTLEWADSCWKFGLDTIVFNFRLQFFIFRDHETTQRLVKKRRAEYEYKREQAETPRTRAIQ